MRNLKKSIFALRIDSNILSMKNLIISILVLSTIMMSVSCNKKSSGVPKVEYPETKKCDTVDHYFGTAVPDPYRWLEDDYSEETANWVKAQNAVTDKFLSQIPFREKMKQHLKDLLNYPKEGAVAAAKKDADGAAQDSEQRSHQSADLRVVRGLRAGVESIQRAEFTVLILYQGCGGKKRFFVSRILPQLRHCLESLALHVKQTYYDILLLFHR